MRRVAITGLGCVSALGIGVEPFWHGVKTGSSGVRETKLARWFGHHVKISAQVDREPVRARFDDPTKMACDDVSLFALLAADEAVAQAGLSRSETAGPRTAVIIGTGIGGLGTIDDCCHEYYGLKRKYTNPLAIPRAMASAAASQVGMRVGCTGPTFVVSSACSSASQAIGIGFQLVRSGSVERAIVGGSEAGVTPAGLRAWELLRVLSQAACRPFSQGRDGMVLGEGAGILVLEDAELAKARGASTLAQLVGYGTSSDADDLLRPNIESAARAISLALTDAGMEPSDIDYINAHGTGTVLNDRAETKAIRLAFAGSADRICMSSTKPIHGHALGAAGGLELIATILAMREGVAPPTINWLGPDPECDLDVVPNTPRAMPINVALSNSFAFGGINASLVVARE